MQQREETWLENFWLIDLFVKDVYPIEATTYTN
jgi:hypothetical protein